MININESRAKIAILFRDRDIKKEEIEKIYEEFIDFMNNEVSERMGKRLFEQPILHSTVEGEKTGTIEDEEVNQPFFRTKNYITDADDLINVLKALVKWRNQHNDKNISVEVLINNLRVPLYLRNIRYLPPDTYYHLNIINDFEKSFVEELNKQIAN